MTQIKIISDIHLDQAIPVYEDVVPENSKEIILIIAGDLAEVDSINKIKKFINKACHDYRYVLWVFGNHEYYDSAIYRAEEKVHDYLNELNLDNLHILNRKSIVIDGINFIGATLWTDLNHGNHLTKLIVSDKHTGINDFKKIRCGQITSNPESAYAYKFTPDDWIIEHNKDRKFIEEQVATTSGKKVVIVHHAPLLSLVEKGYYSGNRLNAAYGSNLEEFVAYNDIDLIIHGHCHSTTDDRFFDTRIISNAVGGINNDGSPKNSTFRKNWIIEP